MVRIIKLSKLEDAIEFVNAAEKCGFDVDIWYDSIIVDAKSIVGVAALGLGRLLRVQYFGHNCHFEEELRKLEI